QTDAAGNHWATAHPAGGRLSEARPRLRPDLNFGKSAGKEDLLKLAAWLTDCANVCGAWGQPVNAILVCQEALRLQEENLGSTHADLARTLHALARLHEMAKQNDQAVAALQRAVDILQAVLEPHDVRIADAIWLLAL